MSIKRKIRLFIALISLLYCVSLIQSTYAKYVTSADATTQMTIARWNILVNTQDIKNNSNFTNNIQPVFTGNTNIADNVIAPTASGYFDIIINGNDTDVSFTYKISITNPTTSPVSDLNLVKYTIDSGADNSFATGTNYITNDVLYSDTTKTHTIRVYVSWNDDTATQTMSNAQDTAATNSASTSFNVNVNLIQKAN